MPLQFLETDPAIFYPFTQTRKAEDIRTGILTIRQKWELIFPDGNADPVDPRLVPGFINPNEIKELGNATDIVKLNDWAIRHDFARITHGRLSEQLSDTNKVQNPSAIFMEVGAVAEHCYINASEGPVYIGKNALLMEGTMIRGPVAICANAVVKMGTRIYGATTIGPYCTIGGEIKNSILMGYSNKAHDGYLGDSVLGEWCNLGAGTSNSNIKNTAGNIKVILGKTVVDAGNKTGLLMGDYSRAAINTSFNTGTVVGVSCNVFGEGLTSKYFPDFSWGNKGERYRLEKALADIDNWKKLKGSSISETEKIILSDIYHSKTD